MGDQPRTPADVGATARRLEDLFEAHARSRLASEPDEASRHIAAFRAELARRGIHYDPDSISYSAETGLCSVQLNTPISYVSITQKLEHYDQ